MIGVSVGGERPKPRPARRDVSDVFILPNSFVPSGVRTDVPSRRAALRHLNDNEHVTESCRIVTSIAAPDTWTASDSEMQQLCTTGQASTLRWSALDHTEQEDDSPQVDDDRIPSTIPAVSRHETHPLRPKEKHIRLRLQQRGRPSVTPRAYSNQIQYSSFAV
nr:hypothetical protein CFP56_09542 [Quercus suber]